MSAWIKVSQSLRKHPKTSIVAKGLKLKPKYAMVHVILLWMWALDYAPTGKLPDDAEMLAEAAEWDGDANAFLSAMVASQFIDINGDGEYEIHDWHEYAGALIGKRKQNAARQQKWKQNHR